MQYEDSRRNPHRYADGLNARAAGVTLKERRRLVLLARETPLSEIQLENMLALSRMGAIIAPPVPAFYSNPVTIDDLIAHTVGRVLDLFGLELPSLKRWNGFREPAQERAAFVRGATGERDRAQLQTPADDP